jgi:hypothetical protein
MYSEKRFSQASLVISTNISISVWNYDIPYRSTVLKCSYLAVSIGNNIFPNRIMNLQLYRRFIFPDYSYKDPCKINNKKDVRQMSILRILLLFLLFSIKISSISFSGRNRFFCWDLPNIIKIFGLKIEGNAAICINVDICWQFYLFFILWHQVIRTVSAIVAGFLYSSFILVFFTLTFIST